MHAVGGNASFNDGNGKVSSNLGGAQFGLDVAQLGDSSTRVGLTAGYGYLSSAVTMPGGRQCWVFDGPVAERRWLHYSR
jgi:outer membrane autotransporter protein